MNKKVVLSDACTDKISYALLEMPVGELFVACMDGKVIYASLVGCDADLGLVGSFCVASNQMELGIAGLREFLEVIKVQGYKLDPNYDDVFRLVNAIKTHDDPIAYFELYGTEFQQKVWRAVVQIKKGKVVTYSKLAEMVGRPKAVRAVANALAANNIAFLIPCHRVIRSDGSCGGYRWGERVKRQLISREAAK